MTDLSTSMLRKAVLNTMVTTRTRAAATFGSAVLVMTALGLASCASNDDATPSQTASFAGADTTDPGYADHETAAGGTAKEKSVWGYEDVKAWGDLPEAGVCNSGVEQSPIDITSAAPSPDTTLAINYTAGDVEMIDTTHTVGANFSGSGEITIGDAVYKLANLHYHTPSEHTIDGVSYPAEFHFVNRSAEDKLSVVGVMLKEGPHNDAWQGFIDSMPAAGDTATVTLDPTTMLPSNKEFYRYAGSLTTPPCSEGVVWNVMKTPVEVSADQLKALTQRYTGNNRPVQSLDSRAITEGTAS